MKLPDGGINAVYPDSGVAAMLAYQWKPTAEGGGDPLPFRITSLNDRMPVSVDDMAVVVACPDPQVWTPVPWVSYPQLAWAIFRLTPA